MQDVILHLPQWLSHTKNDSSPPPQPPSRLTIIFFTTGNPGLIAYYGTFLKLLAEGAGNDAVIAGASLGGFEARDAGAFDNTLKSELLYPPVLPRQPLYDLQGQVKLTHERLITLVTNINTNYPARRPSDTLTQVVLIGHSVGAYIALQLVHTQHSLYASQSSNWAPAFEITATMLLTPTIQDIATSSSGKIATPLLSNLPFFPALLQLGAGTLTSTMPMSWLGNLVSRITSMKAGSEALAATVQFLRTPGAVKQALYMARCEMGEIGAEQWKDEVWGAADAEVEDALPEGSRGISQGKAVKDQREDNGNTQVRERSSQTVAAGPQNGAQWKPPKHYFLFAKQDHWVANETRDAIVQTVGGRAKIVVDEPEEGKQGIVHAWCLEQNDKVATIVNAWLEEILC